MSAGYRSGELHEWYLGRVATGNTGQKPRTITEFFSGRWRAHCRGYAAIFSIGSRLSAKGGITVGHSAVPH